MFSLPIDKLLDVVVRAMCPLELALETAVELTEDPFWYIWVDYSGMALVFTSMSDSSCFL